MKAMFRPLAHHIGPAVRHEELRLSETCFLFASTMVNVALSGDVGVCLKKRKYYLHSRVTTVRSFFQWNSTYFTFLSEHVDRQ